MDRHSPNPCGPESARMVPESSNPGGKRAQVVPPRGPASGCGHRCVSLCQPLWETEQPGESGFLRGWQQLLRQRVRSALVKGKFRRAYLSSVLRGWRSRFLQSIHGFHSFPTTSPRASHSHKEQAMGEETSVLILSLKPVPKSILNDYLKVARNSSRVFLCH